MTDSAILELREEYESSNLNNLIENKIRPLALGRKNYLFAGNHKAGQPIAMMYSFFATCNVKNVNPKRWFENTLDTLADPDFKDYKSLLP